MKVLHRSALPFTLMLSLAFIVLLVIWSIIEHGVDAGIVPRNGTTRDWRIRRSTSTNSSDHTIESVNETESGFPDESAITAVPSKRRTPPNAPAKTSLKEEEDANPPVGRNELDELGKQGGSSGSFPMEAVNMLANILLASLNKRTSAETPTTTTEPTTTTTTSAPTTTPELPPSPIRRGPRPSTTFEKLALLKQLARLLKEHDEAGPTVDDFQETTPVPITEMRQNQPPLLTQTPAPIIGISPNEEGPNRFHGTSLLTSALPVAAPSILSSLLDFDPGFAQATTTTQAPSYGLERTELPQPPFISFINTIAPLVKQYWPFVEPYVREYLPGIISGLVRNVIVPGTARIGDFFRNGAAGFGQNLQSFLSRILPGIFPPSIVNAVAPSQLPSGFRRFDENQGQYYYTQQPHQYFQLPSPDTSEVYHYSEYPVTAYEDPRGVAYARPEPVGARHNVRPSGVRAHYDHPQPAVRHRYTGYEQPPEYSLTAEGGAQYEQTPQAPADFGRSAIGEEDEEDFSPTTEELSQPTQNSTVATRDLENMNSTATVISTQSGETPYGQALRSVEDWNKLKVRWFTSSRYGNRYAKSRDATPQVAGE